MRASAATALAGARRKADAIITLLEAVDVEKTREAIERYTALKRNSSRPSSRGSWTPASGRGWPP